ncbi:hypothetical protein A6R68_20658 [Neotoma lepida]|uniref:Uncharacterized protein n=1 Tax=Neotoma lepida TaxID=56216 RepID=A0A1A6HSA1_NEOLE|nr:hypothetical protein A6R68_20658 [Neotoma lepida]
MTELISPAAIADKEAAFDHEVYESEKVQVFHFLLSSLPLSFRQCLAFGSSRVLRASATHLLVTAAAIRGTIYSRPPVSSNMMTTSDTVILVTPPITDKDNVLPFSTTYHASDKMLHSRNPITEFDLQVPLPLATYVSSLSSPTRGGRGEHSPDRDMYAVALQMPENVAAKPLLSCCSEETNPIPQRSLPHEHTLQTENVIPNVQRDCKSPDPKEEGIRCH